MRELSRGVEPASPAGDERRGYRDDPVESFGESREAHHLRELFGKGPKDLDSMSVLCPQQELPRSGAVVHRRDRALER
jgi:hypothetical protein